jgi:hypothetical protein
MKADKDRYSSLNDVTAPQAFSAMTAKTNATMTQDLARTTAITKTIQNKLLESILHPAKKAANYATPRNLLLFFVCNDPAITVSSLLLPCNFTCPVLRQ